MTARFGYFSKWLGETAFSSTNLKRKPGERGRLPVNAWQRLFIAGLALDQEEC